MGSGVCLALSPAIAVPGAKHAMAGVGECFAHASASLLCRNLDGGRLAHAREPVARSARDECPSAADARWGYNWPGSDVSHTLD